MIVAHIAEELCQSEFAPVDFELPVGEDGVPALSIPLPDGGRVSIDGKVDRVDLLQRDGSSIYAWWITRPARRNSSCRM